ncbi:hypothetical protein B0H11DRAFT_2280841 [Mycena galericulata]|nr:hypothetical protein B0H11DRAFT_2280841 [Mycena galericulata]
MQLARRNDRLCMQVDKDQGLCMGPSSSTARIAHQSTPPAPAAGVLMAPQLPKLIVFKLYSAPTSCAGSATTRRRNAARMSPFAAPSWPTSWAYSAPRVAQLMQPERQRRASSSPRTAMH